MMMGAGLGIGMDTDRAGPDLLRPDAGGVDCGGAVHAGGLCRIGVELVAFDHPYAVVPPIHRAGGRSFMVMLMVAHRCFLQLIRLYHWIAGAEREGGQAAPYLSLPG